MPPFAPEVKCTLEANFTSMDGLVGDSSAGMVLYNYNVSGVYQISVVDLPLL